MDFRTRLRDQIEYLGLLDKEVASKAGISKRALDSYVGSQGCMPSADVAVRLSKALGVSVEYLITGEDKFISNIETKDIEKLLFLYKTLSESEKNLLIKIAKYLNENHLDMTEN